MKQALKQSRATISSPSLELTGAERASGRALPICRVEALHGCARRSCRGRWPLLLGAVRAFARGRLRARFTDGTALKVLPQGPADLRGHAALARRVQAHDDPQHMRVEPSALRRMVTGSACCARPRRSVPPRSALFEAIMKAKPHPEQGFQLVPWHPQPRQELWAGAHRGGGQARQRYRRDHLRLDQVDPAERARSCLRQTEHAGRIPDPARQHPRARGYYH